jgi:carbohydrate binding protein with CBM4/9 domain
MKTAMRLLSAGVVALGLAACAAALAADDKKDEKNLAANGNFEEVKDGKPVGWFSVCNEGGTVTHKASTDKPKEGKYCLQVRSTGEWGVAGSPKVKIDRTKTYTLTGFARVKGGNATIKIDYFKGDEFLGYSESEQTTKNEWVALKAVSELDNYKEATHLLVAAVIHEDGEAFFDGLVLTAK